MFHRFFLFIASLFVLSCSTQSKEIEVVYEIKKMNDWNFDVSLSILNSTNVDFDSVWSLHWNQQSSIVNNESIPDNIKYEYVAGQSYNILSFGKNYDLKSNDSISIDFNQSGIVRRISDLPVGGFIVSNNEIIDVKFTYNWKNADGIEKLDAPSSKDRYDLYAPGNVLDKSELEIIIPTPSEITLLDGESSLKSEYKVFVEESLNLDINTVKSLFVENFNLDIKNSTDYDISVQYIDNLLEESYKLSIDENKISIEASDRAGALYGLQSLKQLFIASSLENNMLKHMNISDSPRFSYRGMLLDISRNFYGPDKIKQILDYLSFFKINHLDFRLTDDEGWRLEIPGLEELTEVGSKRAYTKDEFESLIPMYGSGPDINSTGSGYLSRVDFIEILQYADHRNIKIIPQISYPSHMRSAIISMDVRYQKYMELGNQEEAEKYLLSDPDDESEYYSAQGFDDNIACICRESAFTFYEKVIDEIYLMYQEAGVELNKFGIGADELPYGAWQKSPICDQFMEEKSIAGDYNALYEIMQRRVYDKLLSYNATMTGWDDILLKLTEKNQAETKIKDFFKGDDVLLFVWKNDWGQGRQDMIYKYANLGYKTVMSNSSAFYFDMVDDKDLDNVGLSWSGYADYKDMWTVDVFDIFNDSYGVEKNNISKEYIESYEKLNPSNRDNIIGIQSQIWSETIRNEDILDYMFMPNIIVFSQKAWSQDPEWMKISDKTKREFTLDYEWNKFTNTIGQRVLPIIDNIYGGLSYDLPKPGGIIKNDSLYANSVFPGLNIKYTLDGSLPDIESMNYNNPVKLNQDDIVNLRLFDNKGRGGYPIQVDK
ncbi:MAG: family 20 glycosylhydrolase [Cryomorphaceae bacterium]|jgi:hexosaminidase|nr:family 20 glycosylhydrolase [Cryomorphaceae bacterium]